VRVVAAIGGLALIGMMLYLRSPKPVFLTRLERDARPLAA
jgi:hypothetical protein